MAVVGPSLARPAVMTRSTLLVLAVSLPVAACRLDAAYANDFAIDSTPLVAGDIADVVWGSARSVRSATFEIRNPDGTREYTAVGNQWPASSDTNHIPLQLPDQLVAGAATLAVAA